MLLAYPFSPGQPIEYFNRPSTILFLFRVLESINCPHSKPVLSQQQKSRSSVSKAEGCFRLLRSKSEPLQQSLVYIQYQLTLARRPDFEETPKSIFKYNTTFLSLPSHILSRQEVAQLNLSTVSLHKRTTCQAKRARP